MPGSATLTTPAYMFQWSFRYDTQTPGEGVGRNLRLEYEMTALEELYFGDRIWDGDSRSRYPDPFGVYRFVRNGTLRLVFAEAPCREGIMVHNHYTPLFSRVRAGETHRGSLVLTSPVDEYSSLERQVTAPVALEELSRVTLIAEYRLRSEMDEDPRPPPEERLEDSGYMVWGARRLVSSLETEPFLVKRRTTEMARFVLPGERP